MKTIKVVLRKEAPLDMGFDQDKTYRLVPYQGENGEWFYRKQKRSDKGGIWLQSHFSVVVQ